MVSLFLSSQQGSTRSAFDRERRHFSTAYARLTECDSSSGTVSRATGKNRHHIISNTTTNENSDKVFIHLQITFGNIDVEKVATKSENNTPLQTQMTIFSSAPRIAKAMMIVATEKKYGPASRAALSLLRTVNGKAWEDSASIFRQIEKIGEHTVSNVWSLTKGPKSIEVLKNNGVGSKSLVMQVLNT